MPEVTPDTPTPPPPKKILNDPTESISELISGLLLQYPNKLRKLANHNVILSPSIDYAKVNILSGGGSGHEPSHAGWVGEGMLSGAILGGIFASPSVSSILAAIRAVTKVGTGGGCLLIVKNYTGDRLNFGMACELANAEGRKCSMVVVADDAALDRKKGITGARGVAGTVFVHKIAGAAAFRGDSLDDVAAVANDVASNVGSLGVALDSVTVPGAASVNDRLDATTIELGLGIHGEAGRSQSKPLTADELAELKVHAVRDYGKIHEETEEVVPLFEKGDEVAVMVNNLGGTSNFEMSILARSVVSLLEEEDGLNCRVGRVYVGSYMTSFNMHGASISILPLQGRAEIANLLDAECSAPAWAESDVWDVDSPRPSSSEVPEVPPPEEGGGTKYADVKVSVPDYPTVAAAVLRSASQSLIDNEPLLTKYDTVVGDGDCGLTMKRGGTEVLKRLNDGALNVENPVALFGDLADSVSASMGGTSGVLLELMFRKMSGSLASDGSGGAVDAAAFCRAFDNGVKAVSFYGGASLGARTMLDALIPAASSLLESGGDVRAASDRAREGADSTAEMGVANAGRSNYLSEDSLMGTPDPGAVAVSLVLAAAADAVI